MPSSTPAALSIVCPTCNEKIALDSETAERVRLEQEKVSMPAEPAGLTIEHILLSVTVISTKESAGQFDDSAAFLVKEGLVTYHGVRHVDARVQYEHTKIEKHPLGCECGLCELAAKKAAISTPGEFLVEETPGTGGTHAEIYRAQRP